MRSAQRIRRGLSLIEVTVSIAAASVLVVAIGSVIVLSSKALPQNSHITYTALTAGALGDQIAEELRYAIAVSELNDKAVTFNVPDRTGDAAAETIRYVWDGSLGGVLTRTFNGVSTTIATGVQDFKLDYAKRKVTTSSSTNVVTDSGEVLLASFSSWPGITVIPSQMAVGTATWIAEGFKIDQVVFPPDTTKVEISRVELRLRKPSSGANNMTVAIHEPSADVYVPATLVIGTAATVTPAQLTTSFAWVNVPLTGVTFPKPVTDLFIVMKGTSANCAQVQNLNSTLAPLNGTFMRWTSDSGSNWQPAFASLTHNDVPFNVFGRYERTTTTNVNTDNYYLTNVDIALQLAAESGTRVKTAARVLNEPGVPGP